MFEQQLRIIDDVERLYPLRPSLPLRFSRHDSQTSCKSGTLSHVRRRNEGLRTSLDTVSTDEESLFDDEEEIGHDEEYNNNPDSSTDGDTDIEVDIRRLVK
ncbi:hypothetical protein AVEN_180846-1 [Araneus ventricosus]|uniref:Uncharacterized protein n=1 Tax=Araneus ventricosus TaxID=182803 RepID=A0A4Y2HAM8_ARAVE|nr:hypothetical protein AVEN_180846-1 [Araneus ventricosus]